MKKCLSFQDIKHNLDSVVNQLCHIRLGSNEHQRLLLLRQRQLIEEDELRLKHYVEYEKFLRSMRPLSKSFQFFFFNFKVIFN